MWCLPGTPQVPPLPETPPHQPRPLRYPASVPHTDSGNRACLLKPYSRYQAVAPWASSAVGFVRGGGQTPAQHYALSVTAGSPQALCLQTTHSLFTHHDSIASPLVGDRAGMAGLAGACFGRRTRCEPPCGRRRRHAAPRQAGATGAADGGGGLLAAPGQHVWCVPGNLHISGDGQVQRGRVRPPACCAARGHCPLCACVSCMQHAEGEACVAALQHDAKGGRCLQGAVHDRTPGVPCRRQVKPVCRTAGMGLV